MMTMAMATQTWTSSIPVAESRRRGTSSSDPLDSDSIPDDMDMDFICDDWTPIETGWRLQLRRERRRHRQLRHGDSEDVFPDDPAEMDDNDDDGTGDNAEPDDDNDMWTDELENTCSAHTTATQTNDSTSTPDYDIDMEAYLTSMTTETVNDVTTHTHSDCNWSDNDNDDIADYNNEGNCRA